MEYVQMTLDDWLLVKEQLKKDLIGVQESFVRIGFTLRKIEEGKLFEQDGYDSLTEFARVEYGLSASTVSRFMNINRKYSIDGYSDRLRPEFAHLGSSKLSEMLALPDGDIEMIRPETSRESIRELKRFNKDEPEQETNDWDELLRKFFDDNPDALTMLYENRDKSVKELIEIVNPSGTRTFRKGLFFLMMYEDDIRYKKHGDKECRTLKWEEFFSDTWRIFGSRDEFERQKEKLSTNGHEVQQLSQKSPVGQPEESEKTKKIPPEKPETTKNGDEKAEKSLKNEKNSEEKRTREVQQTLNPVAPAQFENIVEEKLEIPEPEEVQTECETVTEKEALETVTIYEKLQKKTLSEFAQWASKVGCPLGSSCNGESNDEKCQNCWELYLNQYEVAE